MGNPPEGALPRGDKPKGRKRGAQEGVLPPGCPQGSPQPQDPNQSEGAPPPIGPGGPPPPAQPPAPPDGPPGGYAPGPRSQYQGNYKGATWNAQGLLAYDLTQTAQQKMYTGRARQAARLCGDPGNAWNTRRSRCSLPNRGRKTVLVAWLPAARGHCTTCQERLPRQIPDPGSC